jgi:hypothetical protein
MIPRTGWYYHRTTDRCHLHGAERDLTIDKRGTDVWGTGSQTFGHGGTWTGCASTVKPENYRPVVLLNNLFQLVSYIIQERLVSIVEGGVVNLWYQQFCLLRNDEVKANIKPKYECRCNGRLQTKRSTRLSHTGLVVELEDLKIKTRLTNEKFPSVKGECEI